MAGEPKGEKRVTNASREGVSNFQNVTLEYRSALALDDVTCVIPAGVVVGFIGPDGVGKSSLLALMAGARRIQTGTVAVLGGRMASAHHRRSVCPQIAYMPQGLGRNLYPDLSVRENIEFFGRLFGQSRAERQLRIGELLISTGLANFEHRPAAKLSGGMRQKLGLCCALMHDPDLLILDEPTTGVDPLSRRQFWDLISHMRQSRPQMSVVVATAYMEEATQFDWLIAMDAGRILATGEPRELMRRTNTTTLEETFVSLLPEESRCERHVSAVSPILDNEGEPVIIARDLTRTFGDFVAVDHVSFSIHRGEIFGFVGSNGCGKTTTMKMLAGLLPASSGEALLFGDRIATADMNTKARVGYMSQSFSLYAELTVHQNLNLHARLCQLPQKQAAARINSLLTGFGLDEYVDVRASDLPLGIRQRLSLAVAIVHEPEILILDEPTSGVDPLARDRFWELLFDLSRNEGVTIFVSTHFMNEAARCDRIALMHAGRVLAIDEPHELTAARSCSNLEDAFVSYLEEVQPTTISPGREVGPRPISHVLAPSRFSLRRLLAYATRESLELWRDRIRMAFALFGTAFLMLVIGAGISTDVDNLDFAVLDRDNTVLSRAYLEELRGSRYFIEKTPISNAEEAISRLKSGDLHAAIEIPRISAVTSKKGSQQRWAYGSMAQCHSGPRLCAATFKACTSNSFRIWAQVREEIPHPIIQLTCRQDSSTIRILTASTP